MGLNALLEYFSIRVSRSDECSIRVSQSGNCSIRVYRLFFHTIFNNSFKMVE